MAIGNVGTPDLVTSASADSKITNQQTNIPNKNDMVNYTSILRKGPYNFMTDAFFGIGGFRDGRYLIPYSREIFYDGRRDLCFYKNYVKPILRAMVDPVFNEPIQREVKVGDELKEEGYFITEFLENCDNAGTSLQEFMDEAITFSLMHGVTFVIVDNFRSVPASKQEALDQRLFPYVYLKKVTQLEDYATDNCGNLQWIRFIEDSVKDSKGNEQKRWSRWDSLEYQLQTKDEKGNYVVIEAYFHGLNVLPVIPIYSSKRIDKKDIRVEPPLYDIAKINHAIFNKDSEIRDQERAQAFGFLVTQGIDSKNMNIGLHNFLNVPTGSTDQQISITPQYVSPDAAILEGLCKNNELLREDLFRIAKQSGVVGTEQAKSGVALAFEFTAQEAVLKSVSSNASTVEYQIVLLVGMYTNEDFEYITTYKTDFTPDSREQNLNNYDKVQMIGGGQPAAITAMLQRQAFLENSQAIPEEDIKKANIIYQDIIDNAVADIESGNAEDTNTDTESTVPGDVPEPSEEKVEVE